jgi:endoglucanase
MSGSRWPSLTEPRSACCCGPGTRFFVPLPSPGAVPQILRFLVSGDARDARLLTEMERVPRAVWFTSGTSAQVQRQVRLTMAEAAAEDAVPTLVAYDIPGRDCARYFAGGALNEADYEAWISAFAQGIGNGKAIVILEPGALADLPSGCGLTASAYPFTDAERTAELQYAVGVLEHDPGVSVYLDGTDSAALNVGTITQRLLGADVQDAQGFFLDVREPVLSGHPVRLQHLGPHDRVVRAEHGQRRRGHPFRDRHQPQRRRAERHAGVRQCPL